MPSVAMLTNGNGAVCQGTVSCGPRTGTSPAISGAAAGSESMPNLAAVARALSPPGPQCPSPAGASSSSDITSEQSGWVSNSSRRSSGGRSTASAGSELDSAAALAHA